MISLDWTDLLPRSEIVRPPCLRVMHSRAVDLAAAR